MPLQEQEIIRNYCPYCTISVSKDSIKCFNCGTTDLIPTPIKEYEPKFPVEETKPKIELDQNAVNHLLNDDFLFITGLAGTGKSTLIRELTNKNKNLMKLCSTTGIAAINAGGITINSALGYYNTKSLGQKHENGYLHMNLRKIRANFKNLGIDEISMMGAEAFDYIVDAIDEINNDGTHKKLGLIIIGDLCQLPVISTPREPAAMIVKSKYWERFEKNTIKLDKIWRQDNPNFLKAINLVRAGKGNDAVCALLDCGVKFTRTIDNNFEGTTLIPKNDGVDHFNNIRLGQIDSPIIRVTPTYRGTPLKEWENHVPYELRLKVGAYVMILANDSQSWTFCNGDTGIIEKYDGSKRDDEVFHIRLKRNNELVRISRIKRENRSDKMPTGEHFNSMFSPYVDNFTGEWVMGTIKYIPLRLAYASTIHKCLSLGTRVYSSNGYKRIEDIQVGELLSNGETVLAKIQTLQPTISFKLESGYEIECSPNHRFPIKGKLIEAKDIKLGDMLTLESNKTSENFSYLLDPDLAYLLGVLVGDGSYRDKRDGTIEIASRDEDIRNRTRRFIESLGINYHTRKDFKATYFISKAFRAYLLEEFGLDYTLAINKEIPNKIFLSDRDSKYAFLRGLFDTDGNVSKTSIRFTSASKKLARDVQLLLLELGIRSTKVWYKNDYEGYFQIMIPNDFQELFAGIIGFEVKYKRELLAKLVGRKMRHNSLKRFRRAAERIVEIFNINLEIPMIDIEVTGNHLFTANGISTHNSQGLSLDLLQIDSRHSFFGFPNMSYVSISRCRTPEGLTIIGEPKFVATKIKVSKDVLKYI